MKNFLFGLTVWLIVMWITFIFKSAQVHALENAGMTSFMAWLTVI